MSDEIKSHVKSIAQDITNAKYTAHEYMEDALDIQWITNQDKTKPVEEIKTTKGLNLSNQLEFNFNG